MLFFYKFCKLQAMSVFSLKYPIAYIIIIIPVLAHHQILSVKQPPQVLLMTDLPEIMCLTQICLCNYFTQARMYKSYVVVKIL